MDRYNIISKMASNLRTTSSFFSQNKAISPVVATALLLVVAVFAVVGFQTWFGTYSSGVFSDIDIQSNSALEWELKIDRLIGDTLYVLNNFQDNLSITELKIGENLCTITDNLTLGMNEVPVSSCAQNLTTSTPEIVLTTYNNIVSKKVLIEHGKSSIKSSSLNYINVVTSLSPVNWWRLGESSGNATDEQGTHELIWTASPVYSQTGALTGDSNTAILLNGIDQRAEKTVSGYRSLDQEGTVMLWYKTTSSEIGDLFTVGNTNYFDFALELSVTGTPYLWQRSGAGTQNQITSDVTNTNDGNWHFFAVTSNGTNYKLYVDGYESGIIINAGANDGKWFSDTANLDMIIIGGYAAAGNRFFNGVIDEVAVFNYSLSASNISDLYNIATN